MRIKVLGNGGRENAIRWKLRLHGHEVDVTYPELTVVGPEKLIAGGIADRMAYKHVVAPSMLAARLESSKLWAKQFMQRWDIPTAKWLTYKKSSAGMNQALLDLDTYRNNRPHKIVSIDPLDLENEYYPVVIKEDGLCGGKGVVIAKSKQEAWSNIPYMFLNNIYKSPSNKILFEDFIPGWEASCFVMSDGDTYKILPFCKDHKRLGDNDQGPNTGGMGAYAPHPLITDKLAKQIEDTIVKPTLNGMRLEGLKYKGILYIGLMINENGPHVIEYNVRFGDPECQVLMMLMEDDLAPYMQAIAEGGLEDLPDPKFYKGAALTVCLCSEGYPADPSTGKVITDKGADAENIQVFHASVNIENDVMTTAGGRVLSVTARGSSLDNARKLVYNRLTQICFDNMVYRKDIGYEKSPDNNQTSHGNKRRRGRSYTEVSRQRFKNHSHNRRANLLS